ncbi:MAG: hypothetical protein L0Y58_00590 [Verrucomicrobia subdivision 3 bacterium]|nr:hypothetical protein [Limisphaerales bacterium]
MASEPQKKIEELLHAYARKRREDAGAPVEMHPATRRLLQGEVAKLRHAEGAKDGRSWGQFFLLFWPRFAAGLAIFMVMAAGVWTFMQPDRPKVVSDYVMQDAEAGQKRVAESLLETRVLTESEELARAKKVGQDSLGEGREREVAAAGDGLRAPVPEMKRESGLRDAQTRPGGPAEPSLTLAREKQVELKYDLAENEKRQAASGSKVPSLGAPQEAGRRLYRGLDTAEALADSPARSLFYDKNIATSDDLGLNVANANKITTGVYFAETDLAAGKVMSGVLGTVTNAFSFQQALPAQQAQIGLASTNAPLGAVLAQNEWKANLEDLAKKPAASSSGIQPVAGAAAAMTEVGQFERQDASGPAVLQRFTVEHAGSAIRVRDSDGSVYEGKLLTAAADTRAVVQAKDELNVRQRVNARFGQAATNSVSFTAIGTNTRLRLPVVVTGELVREQDRFGRLDAVTLAEPRAAAPAPTTAPRSQPSPLAVARGELATTNLPFSEIRGRIRVGATNVIDLKAVRVR